MILALDPGTTCPDCTRAQSEPWPGHSAGCKGCDARALFRVFLAKGEQGQRYRLACELLGVSDVEVRHWAPQEVRA